MKGLIPFKGLLSKLYGSGVCFRHFLYDNKFLTEKVAPLPVVSIGNVVTGGAGKTQAALFLVEALSKELKVALLSRGYKGQAEHAKRPFLVQTDLHHPFLCGDEPFLLASRLKNTWVLVNKNRLNSSIEAARLGAEILVLDDGMQHRQLHRDYEIVIIDGKASLDAFLPKGNLREDLTRLKNAHLILFVGNPADSVSKTVFKYTSAPYVTVEIENKGLFYLDGQEAGELREKKIAAFCGIGDPQRFVRTLQRCGAHVLKTLFSKDHELPSTEELHQFALSAKEAGAEILVCTEKDQVKWPKKDFGNDFALPIAWLKASLQIVDNEEKWAEAVATMKSLALR